MSGGVCTAHYVNRNADGRHLEVLFLASTKWLGGWFRWSGGSCYEIVQGKRVRSVDWQVIDEIASSLGLGLVLHTGFGVSSGV